MRTLHVITGLGAGGAEQQLRLLLRHLPVHSDVVTLTNPGTVARGLTADGIRVVHLGMTGNRDLGALPRLTRFVRDGRYDLVHTHLYRACVYGRFAARLAGVRAVVATEHSLGESRMEGRPLSAGVRALYLAGERVGRATLAVSPSVAGRLARWGVPRHRIHVVPNGIDVERFAHDPALRDATRHVFGLHRDDFVIGESAVSSPASASTSSCGPWPNCRTTYGCSSSGTVPRSSGCAGSPRSWASCAASCSPASAPTRRLRAAWATPICRPS